MRRLVFYFRAVLIDSITINIPVDMYTYVRIGPSDTVCNTGRRQEHRRMYIKLLTKT